MNLPIALPSQEYLKQVLDYNPDTGVFKWRVSTGHQGRVGDIAGTVVTRGYRQIKLGKKSYREHRLAWKYVYGVDPVDLLDHIDGDTGNNAINNLREVNSKQNSFNKKRSNRNSSGFTGVYWVESRKRWLVAIRNGVLKHRGSFDSLIDAVAERIRAEIQEFGEFRRAN